MSRLLGSGATAPGSRENIPSIEVVRSRNASAPSNSCNRPRPVKAVIRFLRRSDLEQIATFHPRGRARLTNAQAMQAQGPAIRADAHVSDPALRSGEFRPIEIKRFAYLPNQVRVELMVRTDKNHVSCPPLAVYLESAVTFSASFVPRIEAAPLVSQPFSECRAFHRFSPLNW